MEELQRWQPDSVPSVAPGASEYELQQAADAAAAAEAKRRAFDIYQRFVARSAPFEVRTAPLCSGLCATAERHPHLSLVVCR